MEGRLRLMLTKLRKIGKARQKGRQKVSLYSSRRIGAAFKPMAPTAAGDGEANAGQKRVLSCPFSHE